MDCLGYDPYEWYGYGLYGLYTDIGDCDCDPRLREMLVPTSETETVRGVGKTRRSHGSEKACGTVTEIRLETHAVESPSCFSARELERKQWPFSDRAMLGIFGERNDPR